MLDPSICSCDLVVIRVCYLIANSENDSKGSSCYFQNKLAPRKRYTFPTERLLLFAVELRHRNKLWNFRQSDLRLLTRVLIAFAFFCLRLLLKKSLKKLHKTRRSDVHVSRPNFGQSYLRSRSTRASIGCSAARGPSFAVRRPRSYDIKYKRKVFKCHVTRSMEQQVFSRFPAGVSHVDPKR